MHDAGAKVAAGRGKFLESKQQRVDQRAAAALVVARPRAGVDHHASRLVDDCHVLVFINNVKRYVFRSCLERREMRLAGNGNALPAAQLGRSLLRLAGDKHVALVDQHLHTGAAHAIQLRCDIMVEALAARLFSDIEYIESN